MDGEREKSGITYSHYYAAQSVTRQDRWDSPSTQASTAWFRHSDENETAAAPHARRPPVHPNPSGHGARTDPVPRMPHR